MEMETVKAERPGITQLKSWLNKNMKVLMSDGRVLVGIFLCTDKYVSDEKRKRVSLKIKCLLLGLGT